MTEIGGHNKFETCEGCPHRKPACHDECEGYKYRRKKYDEKKERIRAGRYEQGIEYIAFRKGQKS